MHIVGSHLEMPLQLSRVGLEGYDAARVEIVARPDIAVPVRSRISSPPVNEIQRGIVGARHPGGAATALPGIGTPGVAARFAVTRYRPESPCTLARVGVVGINKTADAIFSAGDT